MDRQIAKSEITESKPVFVEIEGSCIGIFVKNDRFAAFDMVCPHLGGNLAEGIYDGGKGTITCPWHGYKFKIDTGAFLENPNIGPMSAARTPSDYFDPEARFNGRLKSIPFSETEDYIVIDTKSIR